MTDTLQWVITTIVGILDKVAGRFWERDDRQVAKDKEIIDQIIKILPIGTIQFLDKQDFGGTFNYSNVSPLTTFLDHCERPDFFFINKKLESLRIKLRKSARDFSELLHDRADIINENTMAARIPQPHHWDNQNEFQEIRKKLNSLSDDVCRDYKSLIEQARKLL